MKQNWTKEQSNAINDEGKTILVSAAAGSGKTAVLTERVLDKIINKGVSADKILMVTFTKASANEMRQRIADKVTELINNDPKNQHYKKQEILLEQAFIGTISSFCSKIVKDNFAVLNIKPGFKIADESMYNIILQETIEEVVKKHINLKDKDFLSFINYVGVQRDYKKIFETFKKLIKFLETIPYKEIYLKDTLELYESENKWVNEIIENTREKVEFSINILDKAFILAKNNTDIYNKYYDTIMSDKNIFKDLLKILDKNNYDDIKSYLENVSFCRFTTMKNCSDETLRNGVKALRDRTKDIAKDLKTKYYIYSIDEIKQQINNTKYNLGIFFNVTMEIVSNYEQKLKDKNLLTFAKLEEYALNVLTNYSKDQKIIPSDIALNLSTNYEYIFIDEYQDNSYIQDEIFKAISKKEENLFIVGDIKQSIYSFRNAEPSIFYNKKKTFYDYNKKDYPAKITLSKNFRSKSCVTEFVNFIFTQIMSETLGGILYDDKEKLVSAGTFNTSEMIIDDVDVNF
ncbi:MAG: UvrD-helicase domain-containing protein, partial [Oscillospiraceae bacterium]